MVEEISYWMHKLYNCPRLINFTLLAHTHTHTHTLESTHGWFKQSFTDNTHTAL